MRPHFNALSGARRKPASGDDVVTGLDGNVLSQRLKLVSKVALVTGAAQGIGRAFAHALGEAGAAVAVVDVNADKAEATVAELRSKGIRSVAIQADVTSAADCQRCAHGLLRRAVVMGRTSHGPNPAHPVRAALISDAQTQCLQSWKA